MKLYFRLLWLFITQSHRSRCNISDSCRTPMRVLPNDLDLFGHVNNGVYLTLMDLARTDLLLRSDTFWKIAKNGWHPVVAAETIRFHRSLKLWQRYEIQTKVAGWDDKSIFLLQYFERKGERLATAVVNVRFLGKNKQPGETVPKSHSISTAEFLEFLNESPEKPETPEWILAWHNALFNTSNH